MSVFKYFAVMVELLFTSTDNPSIKGALILLLLIGFAVGFALGLIVSHIAHKHRV